MTRRSTVKRVTAFLAAAALGTLVAATAPASAATPADGRVVALEKQVRVLQRQVKTLQAQITVVRKTVDSNHDEVRNDVARNRVGDACIALAVADLFQSTWTNVDQRLASTPAFGPQQQLDDVSCKAIGVTRPGIQTHPTVDVFWSLTGWLIG
jgi:hypothetical protein